MQYPKDPPCASRLGPPPRRSQAPAPPVNWSVASPINSGTLPYPDIITMEPWPETEDRDPPAPPDSEYLQAADESYTFLLTAYLVAHLAYQEPKSTAEKYTATKALLNFARRLGRWHERHQCPKETITYWADAAEFWRKKEHGS